MATYRNPGQHLDVMCGAAIEHAWRRRAEDGVAVGKVEVLG